MNKKNHCIDNDGLVEDQLIIFTQSTLDLIFAQKNPAELHGLYTFYLRQAKRQKTNQPWATDQFTRQGLNWGRDKLEKVQDQLMELGLIQKVKRRNEKGQFVGWYIRLRYKMRQQTEDKYINEVVNESSIQLSENPQVDKPTCGQPTTNAYSDNNKNAYSDNNEMLTEKPHYPLSGDARAPDSEKPESEAEGHKERKSQRKPKQTDTPQIDYDEFRRIWNSEFQHDAVPKIRTLTHKRKQKLDQRAKEFKEQTGYELTLERWQQLLKHLRKSRFLMGCAQPNQTWIMNFDFIVRSEHVLTRILEGTYHEPENTQS